MTSQSCILRCTVYLLLCCLAVAVVVAFFICWAPFHIQRLLISYTSGANYPGQALFFYVSGILYFVSSVINPILYNIMSLKFRQAFVETICSPYRFRKRNASNYHFSPRSTPGGGGGSGHHYRFCSNHQLAQNSGEHDEKLRRAGSGVIRTVAGMGESKADDRPDRRKYMHCSTACHSSSGGSGCDLPRDLDDYSERDEAEGGGSGSGSGSGNQNSFRLTSGRRSGCNGFKMTTRCSQQRSQR